MVRFDGYYIEEPIEVYNGRSREEKSSYLFNAYYFLDNENLKISSKHELISHLSDFTKIDFQGDNPSHRKFKIKDDVIIIIKEYDFAKDIIIKIINDEHLLLNNTTNLYFISWKDVEKKKSNDIYNSCINKIFGPFYHNKFKVYYE